MGSLKAVAMLPKNTSGVTDIFPIRWDNPQKLGWGILVEFAMAIIARGSLAARNRSLRQR